MAVRNDSAFSGSISLDKLTEHEKSLNQCQMAINFDVRTTIFVYKFKNELGIYIAYIDPTCLILCKISRRIYLSLTQCSID